MIYLRNIRTNITEMNHSRGSVGVFRLHVGREGIGLVEEQERNEVRGRSGIMGEEEEAGRSRRGFGWTDGWKGWGQKKGVHPPQFLHHPIFPYLRLYTFRDFSKKSRKFKNLKILQQQKGLTQILQTFWKNRFTTFHRNFLVGPRAYDMARYDAARDAHTP
jgi:hypothetical protein